MTCTTKTVVAAPAASPRQDTVTAESASSLISLPVRELNLRRQHGLYLVGNQPVLVWNTTTVPYQLVTTLNFGGSITVMYSLFGYVYGLVVFADGSRLRQRAQIGGQWVVELASSEYSTVHRMHAGLALQAHSSDNLSAAPKPSEIVASAARRAARELSVADPSGYITEYSQSLDVVIMFDPYFVEISAFLPNGTTIILTETQHYVPYPKAITFSTASPNTLLITGTSANSGFMIAQFMVTTTAFYLQFVHTAENTNSSSNNETGLPWCNVTSCRIASLCQDHTAMANTHICIVHHPDGLLPVTINSQDGTAVMAPAPFFSSSSAAGNFTVDYIASDTIRGAMYVAFHFDETPSVIFGFSEDSLVPSFLQQLSTTLLGDPERAIALEVASEERLLTVLIILQTSSTIETRFLNLFDVTSVTPDIVDSDGSAEVTLTGYGFEGTIVSTLALSCVFSEMNATVGRSIQIPGVLHNSTTITCVLPSAVTLLACVPVAVNVLFGADRITARDDVLISRPSSAEVHQVTTEFGDVGYITRNVATTLSLSGFGFVSSPFAHCKLVNHSTTPNGTVVLSTVVVMEATFISLTQATCNLPDTVSLATTPTSYITYSHDNITYGKIVASFSVVSAQYGVHVYDTASIFTPLTANWPTSLPTIVIYAVDVQGNAIRRFETSGTRYGVLQPMSANATLATTSGVPLRFLSSSEPWISTSMSNGVATIAGAALHCPTAGMYTFTVADVPFRYMKFSWNVTILVGKPVYIRVVEEAYYTSVWRVPASEYRALNPGLLAFCSDVCGNLVSDIDVIPSALQVKYLVDLPEIDSTTGEELPYVATSAVRSMFARVGVDGTYYFDPLPMRSAYGTTTTLTFTSPVGIVDAYTTSPLQTENCQIGQEYAVKGTFLCLPCPLHATCDGSIVIAQDTGYWRSDPTSAVLYECNTPFGSDACLTNGNCLAGYEGPRCSTCQEGYGATGLECSKCSDATLAWIFTAALIAALIGAVVAIAIVTLRPHDTVDGELVYEPHPVLNILRNTVAWIHVTGVIFLLVLGVHGVPKFVRDFLLWFAQVSFIELRISYLSCTLGGDEFARFRLAMIAPVAIGSVAALLLTIRLMWLHQHRYDVTQALLSKSASVRRLSFSSIRKRVTRLGKSQSEKGIPSKMLNDVKKTMGPRSKQGSANESSSEGSIASGEGVHPAERAAYLTELFDDEVPVLPPTHPVYKGAHPPSARRSSSVFELGGTAPRTVLSEDDGDMEPEEPLQSARKSHVSFHLPGVAAGRKSSVGFRGMSRQTPNSGGQHQQQTSTDFYTAGSSSRALLSNAAHLHESFRSQNDVDVLVVFDDEEPPHQDAIAAVQEAGARARELRDRIQGPHRMFTLPDTSSQGTGYLSHERDEWYDNDSQDLLDDLMEEPEDDEDDLYDYNALMLGGSAVQGAAQPPPAQSQHQIVSHLQQSLDAQPKPPKMTIRQLDELTRHDEEAFEHFYEAAASPVATVDQPTAPRGGHNVVNAVPTWQTGGVQRRLFHGVDSTPGLFPYTDEDERTETESTANDQTDYFETDSGIYFVTRDRNTAQPAVDVGGAPVNPFLPPSVVNAVPFNPFAGRPRPSIQGQVSYDESYDDDACDVVRNPFNPWDIKKRDDEFPAPKGSSPTQGHMHLMSPGGQGIEDPYWYSFATKTSTVQQVGKQGAEAWKARVAKAAVDSKFIADDGEDVFDLGLPLKHRILNVWVVAFSITLYLLYPAVLSACIRIFFCETVEVSPGEYRRVLESDRTVMCSSWSYKQHHTAAVAAIILYALALPTLIIASDQFFKRVHSCDDAARWLLSFVCGGLSDHRWRVGSLMQPTLMIALVCAATMPRAPYERRVAVAIIGAAALGLMSVYSVQNGLFPRLLELSRSLGFFVVATLVMMMDVDENVTWTSVDGYLCVAILLAIAVSYVLVWGVQLFRELLLWSETFRDWIGRWESELESRSFARVCNTAIELREGLFKAHERTANIVGVLYPAQEAMMEALKYHAHLEQQLAEKTALLEEQARELEEEEQLFGGAVTMSGNFFGQFSSVHLEQSSGAYTPPSSEGNVETASFASKSSYASTTRSEGLLAVEATALRMTAALAIPAMKRRLDELRVAISSLQAVMTRYKRMVSFSLHLFEYYSERMAHREATLHEGRLTDMATSSSSHPRRSTVDFSGIATVTPGGPEIDASGAASNPVAFDERDAKISQEEEDAFMMQCTLTEVFAAEKVVVIATTQLRQVLRRLTNDAYLGAAVPSANTRDVMKASRKGNKKRRGSASRQLPSFRDSMLAMSLKKSHSQEHVPEIGSISAR